MDLKLIKQRDYTKNVHTDIRDGSDFSLTFSRIKLYDKKKSLLCIKLCGILKGLVLLTHPLYLYFAGLICVNI